MRGIMEVMLGVILVGFVDHVKLSVQLKSSHPLHGVVDRINGEGGPYIGLVMAYPTEEAVLVDSGLFVPSSDIPWVDLSGTYSSLYSLCAFACLGMYLYIYRHTSESIPLSNIDVSPSAL